MGRKSRTEPKTSHRVKEDGRPYGGGYLWALLLGVGVWLGAVNGARAQTPSFPGAVGPGAESVGGRGGRVIAVTTLADDGPGSLRAAVEAEGPRTVVFRVGGEIRLSGRLLVRNPFLTIAGQTAPGGGILLRGSGEFNLLDIRTTDVVVRYLRLRNDRGTPGTTDDIYVGSGGHRVVLDHLSLSWANDELFSIWSTGAPFVQGVTVSWSLLAETLEGHATAALVGSNDNSVDITGVVFDHNLFMHNSHRNPLVKCGSAQVVNNVVYNYRLWGVGLGGGIAADVVGNLFLPGPNTSRHDNLILQRVNPSGNPAIGPGGDPSLFVRQNDGPGCMASDAQWDCVMQSNPWDATGETPPVSSERDDWLDLAHRPVVDAVASLEETVRAHVGASRRLDEMGHWVDARDAVDLRLLMELAERGGTYIDQPSDVGGFPVLAAGTPYSDEDGDGMADAWEVAHGFDASAASDGSEDADMDGYTNLEEFLNGTAPRGEGMMDAGVVDGGTEPADGGLVDGGSDDAGHLDGGAVDGGLLDGSSPRDGSAVDIGPGGTTVDGTCGCRVGAPRTPWVLLLAWGALAFVWRRRRMARRSLFGGKG